MKRAGLPIGDITVFDEDTDPDDLLGRPHQYVDKANFVDTELSAEDQARSEGTVEVFANADDPSARKAYLEEVSGSQSLVGYYIYHSYTYLLRIPSEVSPSRAHEYEMAFLNVVAAE